MKKILTALFALTILVGCSSAEYTTNDLNLEVGLTEEELISEIKETIKVDEAIRLSHSLKLQTVLK